MSDSEYDGSIITVSKDNLQGIVIGRKCIVVLTNSNKYFYYLKDDQKDIVLIDYVRNIKEIDNKLYVIGVSPNETMGEMVYKYFVLDYDSDKLFEYSSLNDMSENDKNIFIEKVDKYFKQGD